MQNGDQIDRRSDGPTVGRIDGQMDGWEDGRMDGQYGHRAIKGRPDGRTNSVAYRVASLRLKVFRLKLNALKSTFSRLSHRRTEGNRLFAMDRKVKTDKQKLPGP